MSKIASDKSGEVTASLISPALWMLLMTTIARPRHAFRVFPTYGSVSFISVFATPAIVPGAFYFEVQLVCRVRLNGSVLISYFNRRIAYVLSRVGYM